MRRICMNREFPPFFDQEEPQLPIIGQIAEFYLSDERSRFEACGVFKASSGNSWRCFASAIREQAELSKSISSATSNM